VTRDGGYQARVSSDGRFLYLTKYDRPGLFRLDLASGEETAVAGAEALGDASLWDVDGGDLVFVTVESMTSRLLRLDLSSGEQRDLRPIDAQPGGGLSLDRRHHRVLFARAVRSESDLVLAALP
jgi:hypothetical protein